MAALSVINLALAALTSLVLLYAGLSKLTGRPAMRASAQHFAIPWPRYRLIGVLEIAAVLGIAAGFWANPLGIAAGRGALLLLVGASESTSAVMTRRAPWPRPSRPSSSPPATSPPRSRYFGSRPAPALSASAIWLPDATSKEVHLLTRGMTSSGVARAWWSWSPTQRWTAKWAPPLAACRCSGRQDQLQRYLDLEDRRWSRQPADLSDLGERGFGERPPVPQAS